MRADRAPRTCIRPTREGRNHDLSSLTSRIHATFDWTPRYDNLDTIAAHALAWEEKLLRERASDSLQAVTA